MHCVGMSTTLHGYMRGLVHTNDLENATFHFSCGRSHVLTPETVPCEATTLNRILPVVWKGTTKLKYVDPQFRIKVAMFVNMVRRADSEGRVNWLVGNQQKIVQSLPKDSQVFCRKGWIKM